MNTQNPLRQILKHSYISTTRVLFASICSALNKICDIVPEILIGISIDVVVNQQNSVVAKVTGISDAYTQLYYIGGLTALLWISESIFEYLYSINWKIIALTIQNDLRVQTYATLQNADLAYFENKTTGGLLNILHDDINNLEEFLSHGPNDIIQLIVNIIVMGSIFFYLSPTIAFVTLLPIPFVVGIAYYFQYKLAALYAMVRETSANVARHIAYRLQGIATIKNYVTESYELQSLATESKKFQKSTFEAYKIQAQFIPTVRMAIMVGFISALVVGGIFALQGKMPINWYAALVFLTQRFLWPFTSLTTITDMYQQAVACAQRIVAILKTRPTIVSPYSNISLQKVIGAINFDTVSFAYSDGTPLFNKISFTIPAKNTVAFVGSTGSGKSTIVKLLLRLYDSQSGTISIDNQNIKNVSLESLRNTIAIVSQEPYLIDGTIAENIAYGTFNATKDAIENAAKLAQAHAFIDQLPKGYDTVVQEHGKNLSGGQRQRISIARALLKKAPILIFDEATSAVDNETESAIAQSIAQLASDHTIIIIAHRLATVRNADTIFVLDKGMIIESGNHSELLAKEGAYANLWNAQ